MADQSKYLSKLHSSRVLVIGGTSGIGYGVAEALLEHNVTELIISSSSADRVKSSIERLSKAYPSKASRISGYACDLGNETTLESNVVNLLKSATKSGKLDHIVHSAGDKLATPPLEKVDFEAAKTIGMVRFYSPIFIFKHARTYMNPGPASSITLTSGSVSEKPIPGWAILNSYATGLHGMARGFALDLKPLRVNLVCPGGVATELWDKSMSAEAKEGMMKHMAEGSTTGIIGQVVDVVESYLFLIKDKNVSGTVIDTNGGAMLM